MDLLFPPTPAIQNEGLHGKVRRSQEKQKIAHDKTALDRDEFRKGDCVLVYQMDSKMWKPGQVISFG